MTRVAIGQRLDVVFRQQLASLLELIGGRLPVDAGDFLPRPGGFLRGLMTIDTAAATVMLGTEWDRLFTRRACPRYVRGPIKLPAYPDESGQEEERAKQAHSRNRVRARTKYLPHRCQPLRSSRATVQAFAYHP